MRRFPFLIIKPFAQYRVNTRVTMLGWTEQDVPRKQTSARIKQ